MRNRKTTMAMIRRGTTTIPQQHPQPLPRATARRVETGSNGEGMATRYTIHLDDKNDNEDYENDKDDDNQDSQDQG